MEKIKNQTSQSNISDNERIKTLENELELKNEIIKSKDEIINSKEEMNKSKIKNLENKNIRGFLNPKYVKMKYNQKEYIFRSERFWKEDKINVENTKLHINSLNHKGSKFIFLKDNDNLYNVILNNDYDGMFNWKIFSDGINIQISKGLSSKFELIEVEGMPNHFYIKDHQTGKYLCNNMKKRDLWSYYIGLSDFSDSKDKERYIFYF